MICLNGKYFHDKKESSWNSPEPCSGSYKAYKRKITLFDIGGNRIGGINCWGVIYKSTLMDNGKWWHSYSLPAGIGEYDSYMRRCDEAEEALRTCGIEKEYEAGWSNLK